MTYSLDNLQLFCCLEFFINKYQVSLLYLIAKQSYGVVTSGTWELVPNSKKNDRGHSLKKADKSSFSAHRVAHKIPSSIVVSIC